MPQPQSPPKPVREGGRWRHAKPSSEEVSEWFRSVPLDEGMKHEDYVSGIVIIPASEKVKRPKPDGRGTEEVWEETFTPYTRVDTRVAYFRQLAEARELIAVVEPVVVPTVDEGAFTNRNMPPGFWWIVLGESQSAQRFLCCTMRVALYRREDWFGVPEQDAPAEEPHEAAIPARSDPRPLREGIATKQVADRADRHGNRDTNALARAETGAVGRALGMAGILVVGTGIATADDIAELMREPQEAAPVALPAPGAGEETEEQLNERLTTLEIRLRPYTDAWREFAAWWSERAKASGWKVVRDAPLEARKGVATKMETMLAEQPEEAPALEAAAPDSSPAEEPSS